MIILLMVFLWILLGLFCVFIVPKLPSSNHDSADHDLGD